MRFRATIDIEVSRVTGKFASKDEISELIGDALSDASPDVSGVGADGDSEYEIAEWEVSVESV
jgi:hypothetical protein